jgi:hypothetical protein
MDPITAAIVAAVTFLGPEMAKEGAKAVVKDAYDGLKSVIRHKWGGDSAVAQSLEDVEAKPESKDLAESLDKQVARSGATRDAEVLAALKALSEALAKAEAAKPPSKTVTITASNVGVGNIDQVSGGVFNIGVPDPRSPPKA